jgi:hypothetical protein
MWRASQATRQYAAGATFCIDRRAANISKPRARKGSYEKVIPSEPFSPTLRLTEEGIHIDLNAMLLKIKEPNQLGILRACVSFCPFWCQPRVNVGNANARFPQIRVRTMCTT